MQEKANFIFSDFVPLLIYHIWMFALYKNAKNICVAICLGFKKNIASLPRLDRFYRFIDLELRRLAKPGFEDSFIFLKLFLNLLTNWHPRWYDERYNIGLISRAIFKQ